MRFFAAYGRSFSVLCRRFETRSCGRVVIYDVLEVIFFDLRAGSRSRNAYQCVTYALEVLVTVYH